ncbi:MAG: helix-turn-helix transcriptional regulator [Lewinellaceae bacterium]|nr:helix-turn-helix transcriptional regulator [Lewinellaceae bacterium]
MSVKFQETAPSPALQPYVAGYWRASFNSGNAPRPLDFKVVPRGLVELVIHLSDFHCDLIVDDKWEASPDFTLIGLWTEAYEVRFRKKVEALGIRFKPDGFFALFGIPAAEFTHRSTDMQDVLGIAFQDYCGRLRETDSLPAKIKCTEDFLQAMLRKNGRGHSYLHSAAELIRTKGGEIKVDELSQKAFISSRQLEREFKNIIGLSPKAYIRIARLRQAQQLIGKPEFANLAQLSYHCGYYDQSHFIRDFKQLTGVAPKSFMANREQFI